MKQAEQEILDHIERFDCHVTSVFDPDGIEPTFSYSIGLRKKFGVPEVIVVGLEPELGHALVNEYRDRVRAGERFEPGVPYSGFLDGFSVYLEPVIKKHRKGYMLSACWLYGGSDFEAVQIVYPTTSGVWPWEPEASDWFRNNQPMLGLNRQPDKP